jgi:hypothetical protein
MLGRLFPKRYVASATATTTTTTTTTFNVHTPFPHHYSFGYRWRIEKKVSLEKANFNTKFVGHIPVNFPKRILF